MVGAEQATKVSCDTLDQGHGHPEQIFLNPSKCYILKSVLTYSVGYREET